jgi:hypothetical protein
MVLELAFSLGSILCRILMQLSRYNIVYRLIFFAPAIVPEHPEEYSVLYPVILDDETLYFPGFSVTVVPEDEPLNDAGFGLLPETVMAV